MSGVSVVIPNKNGAGVLERCLDALVAAEGVGEVILVDDGSSDGSDERAETRGGVLVLRSPGRGFSAAVNHGVALAGSDLVLLLNSDAFVRPDTIARLTEAVAGRPRLGLCAAGLVSEDGRRSKSRDRALTLWRALREAASLHFPPLDERGGLEPAAFVPLACALVRVDAWREVGGLDERFRFYYEDHDLCWRLGLAGWEIAVLWEAEAVHVGGASSVAADPSRWFLQYHESRVRYLRKRYPRLWPLYSVVWLVNALVHAGVWLMRAAVRHDSTGLRWARSYLRVALPDRPA